MSDPVAIDEGGLAVVDAAAHLASTAGGNYLNLAAINAAFRADIVAAIDAGHAADEARRPSTPPTQTPRATKTGYSATSSSMP